MEVTIRSLQSQIPEAWKELLHKELTMDYWRVIIEVINKAKSTLCPKSSDIFKALELCDPYKVKVVLLGQDPYTRGEAHGLSFSVKSGIRIPPPLRNIFEEIKDEYGDEFNIPQSGDLSRWCEDGVLLLNSILTTVAGKSNAHKSIGWEKFTNAILTEIIKINPNVIFIALGSSAARLCSTIDVKYIVKSGHPSPLNTRIPFKGTGVFKEANKLLIETGKLPIRWHIL